MCVFFRMIYWTLSAPPQAQLLYFLVLSYIRYLRSESPLLEVLMLDVMRSDAILKSIEGAAEHNVKGRVVAWHKVTVGVLFLCSN